MIKNRVDMCGGKQIELQHWRDGNEQDEWSADRLRLSRLYNLHFLFLSFWLLNDGQVP